MRALIGVMVFGLIVGCGKGKPSESGMPPAKKRITSKEIRGVRVMRIESSDGTATFVRADSLALAAPSLVCGASNTSCKLQRVPVRCPDCAPIIVCPCEKRECRDVCVPRWPRDEQQIIDMLGQPPLDLDPTPGRLTTPGGVTPGGQPPPVDPGRR